MARLPDPTDNLDLKAQELFDRLKSKLGTIQGMYRTMMNNPELTERMSALGGYLRFGQNRLPADVRELVILWVASRTGAAYEWVQHKPHALTAGVPGKVVEELRLGKEPTGLSPLQKNALTALQYVWDKKSIPSDLQNEMLKQLGKEGLIELVVLCGYYRMIAGVIFAFDVPLPEGESDPFNS